MARHRKASPTHRTRRRLTAMTLAVVGLAGLGLASAAQLNVSGGYLGAGNAVVAACQPADSPISVGFATTWHNSTPREYRATQVRLTNVNGACAGQTYRIRVLDGNGNTIDSEFSSTVPTGAGPFTLTGTLTDEPVENISSVAVVIHS